jgi:hypothetical protein
MSLILELKKIAENIIEKKKLNKFEKEILSDLVSESNPRSLIVIVTVRRKRHKWTEFVSDMYVQFQFSNGLDELTTWEQWCERTKLSVNPCKTVIIPFTRKRTIKGLKEPILFNKMIQLSSEVKYLGITLDKVLTWKKQLDKATSKA